MISSKEVWFFAKPRVILGRKGKQSQEVNLVDQVPTLSSKPSLASISSRLDRMEEQLDRLAKQLTQFESATKAFFHHMHFGSPSSPNN